MSILGVTVTGATRDEAVARVLAAVANRSTLRLAFLNANLANIAWTAPAVRQALSGFLVLNDGIGVDLASRILRGETFAENLNGTDFVPYLLDRAGGLRVYLYGGRPDVSARAAQLVAERWPRHAVVGATHGYLPEDERASLPARIAEARPDIVIVALGNPLQELWIADHVPAVAPCGIGVGALLDFLTGEVKRAPEWVRRTRTEWVYRLAQEPRRLWRRYVVGNVLFLNRVMLQKAGRGPAGRRG